MEIFTLLEREAGMSPAEVAEWLEKLRGLLPWCDVHEVGSTAIGGVIGKQDVDLLVRCNATDFDRTCATLDTAFARNEAQHSSEDFQGYRIGSNFDVAIQVTVRGCASDCFLDFLARLRSNHDLVEQYNALKRQWNGCSMDEYRQAKAAFVQQVLERT